jgi:hypothetical protein
MERRCVHRGPEELGQTDHETVSLRLAVCSQRSCSRAFLICSRCDRGNRYCSKQCARTARRISLVAIRRKLEQTPHAKADRRARARRYRREKKSVTDHGSQAPESRRNLRPSLPPRAVAMGEENERKVPDDEIRTRFLADRVPVVRCVCCRIAGDDLRRGFL